MAAAFLASLLIQLALCALPDTMGDLLGYRVWARTLAREGLAGAYWPMPSADRNGGMAIAVDYPPVFPYLLLLIGRSCAGCSDAVVESLIRVPLVLANLALGLLIFADARRWDAGQAGLSAMLYVFNPAVLFDTCYWGQADSLCALFLAASVVTLTRKPEWAWGLLALAALTKPLAYPFIPLALLVTIRRFGWRRSLSAVGAFALCASLALLPFWGIGRLGALLRALLLQLDAMPYMSVNAHNLWWLLQGGTPWIDARAKAIGPLSSEQLGIALFAVFYAVTLLRAWRSADERATRLAFASVALGFFMLSTHMHENHAFDVLPLLLLAGAACPRPRVFVALVSATLLANMLLHDPYLTSVGRPLVPGPRLVLPELPSLDPRFFDAFAAQGYGALAAQGRGETSLVGVALTALNSQANVLVFCAWLLLAYTGRSFDAVAADTGRHRLPRLFAPAAIVFVAASGLPFVSHALRRSEAFSWQEHSRRDAGTAPSRLPR